MPDWRKIRTTILIHPLSRLVWRATKRVGRASESPTSFGVLAFMGIAGLVAFNIQIPQSELQYLDTASAEESLVQTDTVTQAEPEPYIPPTETFTLKRGETLITLLKRATINNSDAHKIVAQLKDITNLRRLQAGQEVRLKRRADDGRKIGELRLRDSFSEEAVVHFDSTRYKAQREALNTHKLSHYVEGEITDSLYLSAARAGLPKKVIIELIRMMTFDVDFEREIRTGDRFQVYFERTYSPDFNDIENGEILRAKIMLRKRTLDAYLYTDKNGDSAYYDTDGQSTRRALMKTPLDVAVLTSSYGKRRHPVLGYTRMHRGSDFRAPTGTPIMAAGDGIIEMSARNGSYGNYVRIRHNSSYKTAYAHLSRYGRGIKKGKRVKQGQIIGYSGATGRVTGAHLHYEVLVDGKQVNPMQLDLPKGKRLATDELEQFQNRVSNVETEIAAVLSAKKVLLSTKETPKAENNEIAAESAGR